MLQTAIFNKSDLKIDILFVFFAVSIQFLDYGESLVLSLVAGLYQDIYIGKILGYYGAIYPLCVLFNKLVLEKILNGSFILKIVNIFILTLFYFFLTGLFLIFAGKAQGVDFQYFLGGLVRSIYMLFVSLLFYPLTALIIGKKRGNNE